LYGRKHPATTAVAVPTATAKLRLFKVEVKFQKAPKERFERDARESSKSARNQVHANTVNN
jgi:hypothetical protein